MSDEDFSKREWTTRAALTIGQCIHQPEDSEFAIVGVSIYSQSSGEACYVSIVPPMGSVILKDIILDIQKDLEDFDDMNCETYNDIEQADAIEKKH